MVIYYINETNKLTSWDVVDLVDNIHTFDDLAEDWVLRWSGAIPEI